MLIASARRVSPVLVLLIITGALLLYLYPISWTGSSSRVTNDSVATPKHDDTVTPEKPIGAVARPASCPPKADLENIVLSVKTGATEIWNKLPTQLLTVLQCADNLLLFSDLEHDVGTQHVHDVLDRFDADIRAKAPDFEIYRKQQQYHAEGRDLRPLGSMKHLNPDWRTAGHNAAWALDKYKFLHMIERAWVLAPGKEWYVFAETDTYLVWENLVGWLARFDPKDMLYIGKQTPMEEEEGPGFYFAHGGTGFVLSGAAMKAFCVDKVGLASRWDHRIADLWYGDYVLAKALKEELGLALTDAWPYLNGDKAMSLPFGAGFWCKPVVTLHHVRPEEVQAYWDLQQRRHKTAEDVEPLAFRHLHDAFVPKKFPSPRIGWDNLSNDRDFQLKHPVVAQANDKRASREKEATVSVDPNASPAACLDACQAVDECLMYSHLKFTEERGKSVTGGGGVCYLSRVFRGGRERLQEKSTNEEGITRTDDWTSGWKNDRIAEWVKHAKCDTTTS